MDDKLYFEDLYPGKKFSTKSLTVTEAEIKEFARKYDPQPFHLDDIDAKITFFHGLAASGWHTAAMTMYLNVTSGPPIAGGIIGGGGEISWPTPTRPGDVLHVESEVIEATPSRSRPQRGTVLLCSKTINQNDETVQLSTMKLIVFGRNPVFKP